ncbi:hypothetical protein NVP1113A_28 [Vibrio phage 1.113.A._10N.286.51.E7]|nr:hypothetical protein NVP1113A_28 [Vibrio phage 1.113.A._10N.286.51.E7]
MSNNTCGNCPHLEIQDIWRGMHTASCGLTDGIIVPHKWENDTITLWRVPDFCQNKDKKPSSKQAPRKDWVEIKTK